MALCLLLHRVVDLPKVAQQIDTCKSLAGLGLFLIFKFPLLLQDLIRFIFRFLLFLLHLLYWLLTFCVDRRLLQQIIAGTKPCHREHRLAHAELVGVNLLDLLPSLVYSTVIRVRVDLWRHAALRNLILCLDQTVTVAVRPNQLLQPHVDAACSCSREPHLRQRRLERLTDFLRRIDRTHLLLVHDGIAGVELRRHASGRDHSLLRVSHAYVDDRVIQVLVPVVDVKLLFLQLLV